MPNDMHTALLGEIRAEMARRQVTRASVAQVTDSDPATVGRWLSGKTSIRLESLIQVCDLLGVSLEELAHRAASTTKDAA